MPLTWLVGVLVLLAAPLVGLLVLRGFRRDSQGGSGRSSLLATNLCVASLTVWYALLLAEIVFGAFVVQPDGWAFTLASKRWTEKYWRPINSLGYRDIEHPIAELGSKKVAVVLGDSYAAGHAVRFGERFSDLLQTELGTDWAVVNVAQCGWSTGDELVALNAYPYRKLQVVVVAYTLNDFGGAAVRSGVPRPYLDRLVPSSPTGASGWVVENSYLVNFFYWRIARVGWFYQTQRFWRYLEDGYFNEKIWRLHSEELGALARRAGELSPKVIFLVFPMLQDVPASAKYTARVAEYLRSIPGVIVVDLAPRFMGRKPGTLVANAYDAHPNAVVHREVAGVLFREIAGAPPSR